MWWSIGWRDRLLVTGMLLCVGYRMIAWMFFQLRHPTRSIDAFFTLVMDMFLWREERLRQRARTLDKHVATLHTPQQECPLHDQERPYADAAYTPAPPC